MSSLREAATMALVAMKSANHVNYSWACVEAVAVLEAALAEQEQEPMVDCPRCGHCCPQQTAEQEPVEWLTGCPECGMDGGCDCPSGTWNPPQRKPLTINEVEQILAQHNYELHGDRARYIVRMTEEAHGIGEKK